jgi:hypothetical protein
LERKKHPEDILWYGVKLRNPFPFDSSGWLDCSENIFLIIAILSFFFSEDTFFALAFGHGTERP